MDQTGAFFIIGTKGNTMYKRRYYHPISSIAQPKWIKQHLSIKSFIRNYRDAVKNHIWIAISVYVLVDIIKNLLKLESAFFTIIQILDITLFEKIALDLLLMKSDCKSDERHGNN